MAAIDGDLDVPAGATGIVLFAHGMGSGRNSVRNRMVAGGLRDAGLATLLVDLARHDQRFDIDLLAGRLLEITAELAARDDTGPLPLGLFGASTGGGAALVAAARAPQRVRAVVSRGGRPDLAGAALGRVEAPTLLLVGGADPVVLELNQAALRQLRCEKHLSVVPGATHLFEEPGTLEQVATEARDWFVGHLGGEGSGHG